MQFGRRLPLAKPCMIVKALTRATTASVLRGRAADLARACRAAGGTPWSGVASRPQHPLPAAAAAASQASTAATPSASVHTAAFPMEEITYL